MLERITAYSIGATVLFYTFTSYADSVDAALDAYSNGDYIKALETLQGLANKGNAEAQYSLGAMYDFGNGVEEDDRTAAKWYTAAALQGMHSAAFNLGNLYREGKGIPQDYYQAVQWYTKAAEHGDANAQYNLGAMYENGYGVASDFNTAVRWYNKAASHGLAHAQYRLGIFYLQGIQFDADPMSALSWFQRAAGQGFKPAAEDLAKLQKNLADQQRLVSGRVVNLRSKPNTKAKIIGKLTRDQTVFQLDEQDEWVKVGVIEGQPLNGWVHSSLLQRKISAKVVNLRAEPSTEANILTRLKLGQPVFQVESQDEWIKVAVAGDKSLSGWVHQSLLR